ncbi:MAG TPA: CHC2 zinc finger domain-containing protein, partial [Verrucomicrobiae bacterium]|nr:CHC2 zinc finger domain-containing protein [Verrucomicrobiae bacterium]
MAGRIKPEDIAAVKDKAAIEDIVREQVTLRPAGPGSFKGLCPFHDEKTPSFTIRPAVGVWHCFGCQEGGDVISFVQKIDHLSFAEAIERLAGRYGVELHYEDGGGRSVEEGPGRRSRLLEAHRVAQEFYGSALLDSGMPDARAGRDFMRARGFDGA